MKLTELLEEFNDLHKAARAGTLSPADQAKYQTARAALAQLFLTGQQAALQPGQQPRRSLRVARALQVELEFGDGTVHAKTVQLSSRGFGALLASARPVGEQVNVSIHAPGGQPIRARAQVVAVKPHQGKAGTSFRLVALGEPEFERLEILVFDAFLDQFEET